GSEFGIFYLLLDAEPELVLPHMERLPRIFHAALERGATGEEWPLFCLLARYASPQAKAAFLAGLDVPELLGIYEWDRVVTGLRSSRRGQPLHPKLVRTIETQLDQELREDERFDVEAVYLLIDGGVPGALARLEKLLRNAADTEAFEREFDPPEQRLRNALLPPEAALLVIVRVLRDRPIEVAASFARLLERFPATSLRAYSKDLVELFDNASRARVARGDLARVLMRLDEQRADEALAKDLDAWSRDETSAAAAILSEALSSRAMLREPAFLAALREIGGADFSVERWARLEDASIRVENDDRVCKGHAKDAAFAALILLDRWGDANVEAQVSALAPEASAATDSCVASLFAARFAKR
ncbi:MAG TPA: hypothetical protein VK116_00365, partial [Planctomycetota bacterium]|nr:hypothetical protein [Planctomycetota bacterium]